MRGRRSPTCTALALGVLLGVWGVACAPTADESGTGEPEPDASEAAPAFTTPEPSLDRFRPEVQRYVRDRMAWHGKVLASPELAPGEEADAHGELAVMFHAFGLTEAAAALYREAERLDAGDHRWPHYLGNLYRSTNDDPAAAAAFRRALAIADDFVPARIRLAEVLADMDRSDEAQEELQRVLAVDPESAVSHFHLGRLLAARGRAEEAVSHFERAMEIQPEATAVLRPLALAYRDLGREEEARGALERAGDDEVTLSDPLMLRLHALSSELWAVMSAAGEHIGNGEIEDAKQALGAAVAIDPLAPQPRLVLGRLLLAEGEEAEGVRQLELAVFLSHENAAAHAELGRALRGRGLLEEAATEYAAAAAEAPDDGLVRLRYGDLLLQLDRPAAAVVELEAAAERIGDRSALPRLLEATALNALGRCRDALDRIEAASAAAPRNGLYLHALARLLATCGDGAADAARSLDIASDLFLRAATPGHAGAVARAQIAAGRADEALRWQRRAIALATEAGAPEVARQLERDLEDLEAARAPALPWRADEVSLFQVAAADGR
ncbi:MAG: tetratricopeptide repeat protein [Thermoanaerobaculia bacterium]|nr:tetratricopeptide repeat protein [Thermoanaerobaculia bacterium]